MRPIILLPTYNNAHTLADVITDILQAQCAPLMVVDDGSTDETLQILSRFSGIIVLHHPQNLGKGAALRHGFRHARQCGYTHVITMDSDGQHFASDLPQFLQAIAETPDDIIVGNRFSPKLFTQQAPNMSAAARRANRFSNFWVWLQTGFSLEDTQTGFRAYPLHHLHGLDFLTNRYEAELEIMVFSAWSGTRLRQIPVKVYYPSREERVSHFRPTADFFRITLLNTLLTTLALSVVWPLRLLSFVYGIVLLLSFFLLMLPAQAIIGLGFALFPPQDAQRLWLHRLIQRVSRGVLWLLPRVTLRVHRHGEDFTRPAIIVANHRSHLDLLSVMLLTPHLVIMTKQWVWRNPLYGVIIRHAEFLPVTEDFETLAARVGALLQRGYSVLIFPEGTRSATGRLGRFHQGAFALAERFDVDILPLFLRGTGQVLGKTDLAIRAGKIDVEVGHRISPSDPLRQGSTLQQARQFRQYYQTVLSNPSDA